MYVHLESNRVYIAHPKTASLSLSLALKEQGWDSNGPHHRVFPQLFDDDTQVISVIREPKDWYVSWYFHYRAHYVNKEPFFDWFSWFLDHKNKAIYDGDFFGLPYTTDLIFFDRLREGVAEVFGDINLPHKHQIGRNGTPASEFFCDQSLDLLARRKSELVESYDDLTDRRGTKAVLHLQ